MSYRYHHYIPGFVIMVFAKQKSVVLLVVCGVLLWWVVTAMISTAVLSVGRVNALTPTAYIPCTLIAVCSCTDR